MFVFHKEAFPLTARPVVIAGGLHAGMKPRLIFKTDGDSPVDGQADFAGNLTQPVVPVLAGKPAIQPRRARG